LKKPIAILLLLIHSFNLAGYPAIFAWLQHNSNNKFEAQIDMGNYNDAQLVEVKIPYPLPYSTNWKDYERVNGEMEVNGVHYNYVKRKLTNDTLYLMCIPNTEKTNLVKAKHNYLNAANGVAEHNSGKKSPASSENLQKAVGAEYNIVPSNYLTAVKSGPVDVVAYGDTEPKIFSRALSAAFQPPEI